jgi:hypothetical protein
MTHLESVMECTETDKMNWPIHEVTNENCGCIENGFNVKDGCRLCDNKLSTLVFRVVTPCKLAGGLQCFGGTYCLHLQG